VVIAEKSRGRPWLPPLVWAAVILSASSLHELQTTTGHLAIRDKLAHFGEYLVFGWLVARALDARGLPAPKLFLWTMLIGAYMGTMDEFYQGFVPGRERDGFDLLADVIGTLAGWYFSREDRAVGHTHRAPGNT
jgi:VanZ family protein